MNDPIFVGGAQRSGTHALGHLLGSHSSRFMIPREMVVHCAPRLIPGFVRGEVSAEALLEELRGRWWRRTAAWDPEITRGLFKLVGPGEYEMALTAFEARAGEDPLGAARALIEALAAPTFRESRKAGWVEMSPTNIAAAAELTRLFPDTRFVHIVRDGRDVASSMVSLPWGPQTFESALQHWRRSLQAAESATRAVDPERVLVIELERLVLSDRDAAYAELLDFVGVEDELPMRAFLATELTPERAHIGRWHKDVPAAEQGRITELYVELRERMQADGLGCVPALRDSGCQFAPRPDEPPNPLDPWSDGKAADG